MARNWLLIVVIFLLAACGGSSTLRERVAELRLDVPKKWSVHRLGVYCHGRLVLCRNTLVFRLAIPTLS
jgi:hypothetical protein